jgi:hypothetical protein
MSHDGGRNIAAFMRYPLVNIKWDKKTLASVRIFLPSQGVYQSAVLIIIQPCSGVNNRNRLVLFS